MRSMGLAIVYASDMWKVIVLPKSPSLLLDLVAYIELYRQQGIIHHPVRASWRQASIKTGSRSRVSLAPLIWRSGSLRIYAFVMAGRRPRLPTHTSRSSRRSSQAPTALGQAHQLLLAQIQAITALQRQVAARPIHHSSAPRSSAPEKCDVGTSTAAFRSWRRSVEYWLALNGFAPAGAVLHIRLLCSPNLQRSLDARYSTQQWEALSIPEALDAVGCMALQATNQAADWCKFFSAVQGPSESICEYFTRSTHLAADCEFQCPQCECILSEYMLLRKLMCGSHNVVLQDEVFRECESFSDVDSLRKFCIAFEAAQKDARHVAGGRSFGREGVAGAAGVTPLPDEQADKPLLAAVARHQPAQQPQAGRPPHQIKRCGNCSLRHKLGKELCPAEAVACHNCGRVGHVQRMCRSKGKNAAAAAATEDLEASSIVIAAAGAAMYQPRIWVTVSHAQGGRKSARIQAVPDTGAQVCVAGLELLAALDIKTASLIHRGSLRDVANISLQPLGSISCHLQYGDRSTTQEVFIVNTATQCYMSLWACRELGLVHERFPHHTVMAGAAAATSDTHSAVAAPPRPSVLPFPALEKNVPRLEEWLLCHFSGSAFDTNSPLPVMAG
ncbi:hypothetical protein E2C01_045245 [Portunus trituberculatus]|uniref:CCHC-type domain-containing protein n=1 Tax=Portunus trituberculatus TaxID=210409 RepID=A0A5B7FV83_PORTR|nr:hypothetical protein [Portunus trituberculatus]